MEQNTLIRERKIAVVIIFTAAFLLFPRFAHSQEYPEGTVTNNEITTKAVTPSKTTELLRSPPQVASAQAAIVSAGMADYRQPIEPPVKMPKSTGKAKSTNKTVAAKAKTKAAIVAAINKTLKPPVTQEYESVEPEEEITKPNASSTKIAAKGTVPTAKVDADASYYGQTGGTYTIQRGDTMAKISKKLLGSSKRWRDIAQSNPQMDPNKLIVGQTIVIPGLSTPDPAPNQQAVMPQAAPGAYSFDAGAMQTAPGLTTTVPSIEPPPVAPPSTPGMAAFPQSITPPPPPSSMNYSAQTSIEPPPPPPYMGAAPMAVGPSPIGVAPVTQNLYREERYRIPEELKSTTYSPYFANFQGTHGLFNTESALIPYINTWYFGFHFRYDNYRYLNGTDNVITGRQWVAPLNLAYTGHKLMANVSVPFQSWETTLSAGGLPTVSLTGAHDPEVRLGYQIWKNYDGNHAVTIHIAGRFPGGNYHQPLYDFSGKTRVGSVIGPANATCNGWGEFGGAYTGVLNDRWTSHINLAVANDSGDSLTRYMYRTALDYRVNQHFTLISEIDGTTWEMNSGPDGANVDILLGMAVYNENWQGVLGFPMALDNNFGYGHDFGVTCGLNTRWD